MTGKVLVTGGLGFIGSAFIRLMSDRAEIVNVDAQTYAADPRRVPKAIRTVRLDVADGGLGDLMQRERPQIVVHFAAETHVTRSESDEATFFRTNLDGTRTVLDAARTCGVELVIHVSTDEVYGPALDHPFREEEKEPGEGRATSAYARSKALADDLATSYADDIRVVVVRPTNCFGPWQHPEKAIPRWTTRALSGARLPVWGDGGYVRDWMFVDDVCAAIQLLADNDRAGGVYNIGPGGEPLANIDIARKVAEAAGRGAADVYLTDYDRPQHDRRYSVDSARIRAFGWTPEIGVAEGIIQTVKWYAANRRWWEPLVSGAEALYQDALEREGA